MNRPVAHSRFDSTLDFFYKGYFTFRLAKFNESNMYIFGMSEQFVKFLFAIKLSSNLCKIQIS